MAEVQRNNQRLLQENEMLKIDLEKHIDTKRQLEDQIMAFDSDLKMLKTRNKYLEDQMEFWNLKQKLEKGADQEATLFDTAINNLDAETVVDSKADVDDVVKDVLRTSNSSAPLLRDKLSSIG